MKTTGNIYKPLFFILIGLLLVGGAFYLGRQYAPKTTKPTPSPQVTKAVSPELTKSEVSPTKEVQVSTEPVQTSESVVAAVRKAMADKFGKPINEVNVTLTKIENGYAQGGVTFEGEMGGGWLLAAEVGGEWIIVDDGNGTVSCEKIDPYNFPVSMVPECWSETTGELITR